VSFSTVNSRDQMAWVALSRRRSLTAGFGPSVRSSSAPRPLASERSRRGARAAILGRHERCRVQRTALAVARARGVVEAPGRRADRLRGGGDAPEASERERAHQGGYRHRDGVGVERAGRPVQLARRRVEDVAGAREGHGVEGEGERMGRQHAAGRGEDGTGAPRLRDRSRQLCLFSAV